MNDEHSRAMDGQVAFVGAGAVAEALIRGMVATGVCRSNQIVVANRSRGDRLRELQARYGILPADSVAEAVTDAHLILLCAKPTDMESALQAVAPHALDETLYISVATGCSLAWLEQTLVAARRTLEEEFSSAKKKRPRVIRAMPNTSCAVLESATAFAVSDVCTTDDRRTALAIFGSSGLAKELPEHLLDPATGLSGSGPAYFYYMVESLMRAGMDVGFDEQTARELVLQTLYGAAAMLRETGMAPKELRAAVTSPGGTTAAGIALLEERGFDAAVRAAVHKAATRAEELGRLIAQPESRAPSAIRQPEEIGQLPK